MNLYTVIASAPPIEKQESLDWNLLFYLGLPIAALVGVGLVIRDALERRRLRDPKYWE